MAETEAIRGVITKGVGGVYTVRFFNDGTYEYVQCAARGAFRLKGIKPAIGDKVSIMSSGDPDIPYVIKSEVFMIFTVCKRSHSDDDSVPVCGSI